MHIPSSPVHINPTASFSSSIYPTPKVQPRGFEAATHQCSVFVPEFYNHRIMSHQRDRKGVNGPEIGSRRSTIIGRNIGEPNPGKWKCGGPHGYERLARRMGGGEWNGDMIEGLTRRRRRRNRKRRLGGSGSSRGSKWRGGRRRWRVRLRRLMRLRLWHHHRYH